MVHNNLDRFLVIDQLQSPHSATECCGYVQTPPAFPAIKHEILVFQNLAEAEYCVAVFMYMRLLGYPAEKISILTTYNGQKHLIRDVINIRCASNPLIGRPHKVRNQHHRVVAISITRTLRNWFYLLRTFEEPSFICLKVNEFWRWTIWD